MKSRLLTITLLLFAAVSCIDKDPSWNITWGTGDPGGTDPYTEPKPHTDPDPPSGTDPKDVEILQAFTQDFKTADTAPMELSVRQSSPDFRYFSGFPSLSENDTDILLLRLDPADKPSGCPCLTASGYTFYGSYSIRVKTPDLSLVKQTTDAQFEFSLTGDDTEAGVSGIGMKWSLSNPMKMTLTTLCGSPASQSGNSVAAQVPSGCSPSAKFLVCGWDWAPEYVRWWVQDPGTKERKVLLEITAGGEVPELPGRLSIRVFHTSDAPEYPFETEIDRISYEPYQDHIQAWRDKYFGEK